MDPYQYICQIPGKGVRLKLATAFDYWLHIPNEKLEVISDLCQLLHNASLLIDDIEDNSNLRRGIPVAHHIYGVAQTINSANYMYFKGLELALTLNHADVTRVFTEQLLELHRGQGMDIYWRDTHICPSEEEYKEMVIRKTGGLFGLAIRLMQLFSENKVNLKPLLDNLGLYFQIRDDLANLCSEEYAANKSFAEDLTEGKFSFPIVHGVTLSLAKGDRQISSIVRQRTHDNDVKRYCVEHLRALGSFAYTVEVLKKLEEDLKQQIEQLGGNPHLEGLIAELSKLYKS